MPLEAGQEMGDAVATMHDDAEAAVVVVVWLATGVGVKLGDDAVAATGEGGESKDCAAERVRSEEGFVEG